MAHDNVVEQLILNIVQTQAIAEQSDLQNSLKSRGYDIPQATLSRKLKKLNIVKVAGAYTILDYNKPDLPHILNIQFSDSGLIVLQTHPGNASSLAYYLDRKYVAFSPQDQKNHGILGTIAGDDTVLIITRNNDALKGIRQILEHEFPWLVFPE